MVRPSFHMEEPPGSLNQDGRSATVKNSLTVELNLRHVREGDRHRPQSVCKSIMQSIVAAYREAPACGCVSHNLSCMLPCQAK